MGCEIYLSERNGDDGKLCRDTLRAFAEMCDLTQAGCGAAHRPLAENAFAAEIRTLQTNLNHCLDSLSSVGPCLDCTKRDCTGKFLGVQVPLEAAELLMAVAQQLENVAKRLVTGLDETHDFLDRAVTGH